jgi:hypothetical protein
MLQNGQSVPNGGVSRCPRCNQFAYWHETKLIYPFVSLAPLPPADMPDDVKEDYVEARNIVQMSPRGAAALLRLCVQKLMPKLGEKGENINDDIASLVRKGLPVKIQKALDAVRVIGNNAVHPGEMDLRDDPGTANTLFGLVNLIVQDRITQPKEIELMYSALPQCSQDAIKKRDGT